MNKSDDYELFDNDFDEWMQRGREAFGLEEHPGQLEGREGNKSKWNVR